MLLLWAIQAQCAALPELDAQHTRWLSDRIYANECSSQPACLTSWNAGEEFPSLGIGHFIWYPEQASGPFVETFPALTEYLLDQGVHLPAWIQLAEGAPWPDRQSFQADLDSERMSELRLLLLQTRDLQARFIVNRFYSDLPAVANHGASLMNLVNELGHQQAPHGIFALIDYVHFKGWGVAPTERYQGQGWGLVQVLQAMEGGPANLENFASAAAGVLRRRVQLAPVERNEQRWLSGWLNRVHGYLPVAE